MPAQSGEADVATALWYAAPGRTELRKETLPAARDDEARLVMRWSGLSRGTERLIFEGRVPEAEYGRMRGPMQAGAFPFPVKYGYCAVARVESGPEALEGRTVFCLHPHQDRFNASTAMLTPLPDGLPERRAILGANMETALNALWDAGAGPADRIVVVGAGIIGLLVATLAARLPGAQVTVVDVDASRADLVRELGAAFALPDAVPQDADVVFHASAHPAGLATALACAGMEATVIELSWYGERDVPAPLGGAFHSRRLKLISSQVGQVSPGRRPRWSYGRRIAAALALLKDERFDALVSHEVAFADLPTALPGLLAPGAPGLTAAIRYS